ncbi:MAG: cyclic nucleotide-binding domain-containing protein [Nitrospirae bacterium]|nr:cyclic nucleotide-binding domain-containing protein [Nitrospirota bacterium]
MWREKDIVRAFKKGDTIIGEGDPGREMFIIQSGSVDVFKGEGEGRIHLATLQRGDFFGEMSILENVRRSATVIAREETSLLVLNAGNFLVKIRKDPTFAFSLMQRMSNRIRVLNEKLSAQKDAESAKTVEMAEYLK